jgi:hypothetical protein
MRERNGSLTCSLSICKVMRNQIALNQRRYKNLYFIHNIYVCMLMYLMFTYFSSEAVINYK